MSCHEGISVITLTRHRPAQLLRAIASVHAQDHPGPVEHVVVVDDDPETLAALRALEPPPRRRHVVHLVERPERDRAADDRAFVYPRLATLLNIGARLAGSPWVAFLDDDNEFEPDHLSSLLALARSSGVRAVHSVRQVVWADGRPYLEPRFPWALTPEDGARIYDLMCERGVWERGTNILRDRADPGQTTFRTSTVLTEDDPVLLVDQNVWLLDRDLLLAHPLPERLTEEEIAANVCPDDKMLEELIRNDVEFVSSGLPTVRYYLGGISNPDLDAGA